MRIKHRNMTDDSRSFLFCHTCQIEFDADELSSEEKWISVFFFFSVKFSLFWGRFRKKMEWKTKKENKIKPQQQVSGVVGGWARRDTRNIRAGVWLRVIIQKRVESIKRNFHIATVLCWAEVWVGFFHWGVVVVRMRQHKKRKKTKTKTKKQKWNFSFAFLHSLRQNGLPFSSSPSRLATSLRISSIAIHHRPLPDVPWTEFNL